MASMGARLVVTSLVCCLSVLAADDAAPPLSKIRSICVDKMGGQAEVAAVVRELIFAALFAGKRFVLMESCERAEAVVKGGVLETADLRGRSEGDSVGFGGFASSRRRAGGTAGAGAESLSSIETRRQATVSMRLVGSNGIVVWANAQDSTGGKAKSAVVDGVERVVARLLEDAGQAPPPVR